MSSFNIFFSRISSESIFCSYFIYVINEEIHFKCISDAKNNTKFSRTKQSESKQNKKPLIGNLRK